jgi:hypothetical protein
VSYRLPQGDHEVRVGKLGLAVDSAAVSWDDMLGQRPSLLEHPDWRSRIRVRSVLCRAYSDTTVERVSDIVDMSIIDINWPETSLVSAPIARAALSASR